MDLRTTYLGLELENPLVPSSSPLTRDLEQARRLEDAGAGALVMHSLFEEEIEHENLTLGGYLYHQGLGHPEATSFLPLPHGLTSEADLYLEQVRRLKESLAIPVIASLNGTDVGSWIERAREIEQAGADALELNAFYIPSDPTEPGPAVEERYVALMRELRQHVALPIAVKLTAQFSSPGHLVRRLTSAGADGVTLFNRFYQPDIDLDSLRVAPNVQLSSPAEAGLTLRWIAILHGRVACSLGASGGVHSAEDALKMLLAGADVVHMVSALLAHGPAHLRRVLQGVNEWLETHHYESLAQVRGVLSQAHTADPAAYNRVHYVRMLESYHVSRGVHR